MAPWPVRLDKLSDWVPSSTAMSATMNEAVALAQARFTWAPPEGGEVGDFTATLYSAGAVELSAPGTTYNGVVMGLAWSEENQAIVTGHGFWSHNFKSNKDHLLLKATNALRQQLGLPPHSATGRYPGTEVT